MAAYAALTSLMCTTELLSRSVLGLQEHHKQQLKLLNEKVDSLLHSLGAEPTTDLQVNVKGIALAAEDAFESLVEQLMGNDLLLRDDSLMTLGDVTQQAVEGIDSIMKQLIEQEQINTLQSGNPSTSQPSDVSALEDDMVGRIVQKTEVIGKLTGGSAQLEVISVVGMAGIGKSTFAKTIFQDLLIKGFFHVRGWIAVSSDKCNFKKVLRFLLKDAIGMEENELKGYNSEGKLAGLLKRKLKEVKSYLIIVDDIWKTDDWDTIRQWFPEDYCGVKGRIVLTSRDKEVAEDAATSPENCIKMDPLEAGECWKLFRRKAFAKDDKNPKEEFMKVGKEVVEKCKGLPLMITVIAGILSRKSTLDEWRTVGRSVSSLVNDDAYQQCLGVLALSYHHLPCHMKPCFLHFGVFPKGSKISVKKLIRLWVAEGLLKLNGAEDFEKVAAKLLHELIDKSLVIVEKRSSLDGEVKTCRIHDLFHVLCLREAETDNLFDISQAQYRYVCQGSRWVSLNPKCSFRLRSSPNSSGKTRSLYIVCREVLLCFRLKSFLFKHLRVLDIQQQWFLIFPGVISELVCLRYLALTSGEFPNDLAIPNLQTLIIRPTQLGSMVYFREVNWQMSQLRHLHFAALSLSYHPTMVLENLQSVFWLSASCCTKQTLKGIKRVKELGICFVMKKSGNDPILLDDLKYLRELEELHIKVRPYKFRQIHDPPVQFTRPGSFPKNLKKLKLKETALPWQFMALVGKLPNLEVLRLERNSFIGEKWEVTESGFDKLKFLLLDDLSLRYWSSNSGDHFPSLERVIIRKCSNLKKIPRGFEESTTLQVIETSRCSSYLVSCVDKIQKRRERFGMTKLKVTASHIRRYLPTVVVINGEIWMGRGGSASGYQGLMPITSYF